MKYNIFLFSFIFIFCIGLVSSATTSYTPTTTTECNDGICTKTFYSNIQNVIQDDKWVDVDKAVSLKGTDIGVVFIEEDPNYPIEVVDYNASSITVKLNPKGIVWFGEDVPIRVWEPNNTKAYEYESIEKLESVKEKKLNVKFYQEVNDKVLDNTLKFSLLNQEIEATYEFGAGKILEFGPNSTTITLQTANSENLEDCNILSGSPTTNTGNNAGVAMGGYTSGIRNGMVKFNVSSLDGTTILTANVSLYMQGKYYGAGEYFDVKATQMYDNYVWDEHSAIWNNRPTDGTEVNTSAQDSILFDLGSAIGWYVWDVDEMLTDEVTTGDGQNLSIYFVAYDFNSNGVNDVIDTASKENAVTANRPKLAVTYEEAPSDTCTYSSGNWAVDCADNCSITSDVNLGGNNITITGAGTFTTSANITNFGSGSRVTGINSSSICTIRCLNGGCLNF